MANYKIGWLDLSNKADELRQKIVDKHGILSEEDYRNAYNIVSIYYSTWDTKVAYCTNNDLQYSPPLFVWYATNILKCNSVLPIRIMRAVYNDLN